MNAEGGGLETNKAARTVLTERPGAKTFVAEVGVGGGSVPEQVDFALAVQKACVSISKVIELAKAGALCSALFQQMYSEDILEEEGILGWWKDARATEGDAMDQVKGKCKALVDWLEQASEEESEEESDDDDDE